MAKKYIPDHPRLVRGGSVHRTQGERKKAVAEEKKAAAREKKQYDAETYSNIKSEVEAKFLAPKSRNFVETETVKKYEDRVMLWVKAGYPVHIIGPTGCGKTALAIRVAEKLRKPVIWINGDETVSTTDLVGGYSKIEMTSLRDKYIHNVHKSRDTIEPIWVSNPLALACEHGYTLIYNEFSRTKPEANNILLSILEEGILELPTKFGEERYVKVHPNFNLILTSNNIEYAGVHRPQDALLDRIATVHMDYYDEDTEIKIVQAHAKKTAYKDVERIINLIRSLRKKLDGPEKPGTRPAIMIALGLEANGEQCTKELFEQICIDAIGSKFKDLKDTEEKTKIIKKQIWEAS